MGALLKIFFKIIIISNEKFLLFRLIVTIIFTVLYRFIIIKTNARVICQVTPEYKL